MHVYLIYCLKLNFARVTVETMQTVANKNKRMATDVSSSTASKFSNTIIHAGGDKTFILAATTLTGCLAVETTISVGRLDDTALQWNTTN